MLAWLLKKFKGGSAESSKILEVIPVTETKALHVVERGAKILLIEVEGEQSTTIKEVRDPNLIAYLKSAKGSLKGSAFLAEYLKRAVAQPTPAVADAEPATSKPVVDVPVQPLVAPPPVTPPAAEPAASAPEPVAAKPEARPTFDVIVDDSTPVAATAEPEAPAAKVEAPVEVSLVVDQPSLLPDIKEEPKAEVKSVVARSQAADAILQKLGKAMDQYAENNGDLPVPVAAAPVAATESLPSTIRISEPVTNALREVVGRQQERVEALREVKRQEEAERLRVEALLRRKKEVEDKIQQIQEMLVKIEPEVGRNQGNVETALLATSRDLQQLEEELSKIMTDNGVIRYLLAERDDVIHDPNNPLDSMVNSVRAIDKQRKQIAAIRHTREQAEAERRRIVVLLIRKNELETAIDDIKQVLKQIDDTNAELIRMDPYAIPEAVPIVAMNELRRLEFELNTILADPGVAKKMAEVPTEGLAQLVESTIS